MKIQHLACGFVLGAAAAIGIGTAFAQDPDAPKMQQPSPEELQKMMKAWKDAATPGAEHKRLVSAAGQYDMVTKIWMAGPDAPPTECKGTSEFTSVLGGRFIMQHDRNTYPMPDLETGAIKMTPMEGIGIVGYDNYQRMYVGCWADSLNTQMLSMRGTLSPDGKTMTMYAEMDEPMLGIRGRMTKMVTHFVSDDHTRFEIFDLAAGDNYKVVEIEYTRKK